MAIKKIGGIKNMWNDIYSRLNTVKEKISEFEVTATESIQREAQKMNHSYFSHHFTYGFLILAVRSILTDKTR